MSEDQQDQEVKHDLSYENECSRIGVKKRSRGNHNQPIVSCLECRRMKWKCDRKFPCANCTKRGLEELCPDGKLASAKDNRELVNHLQQKINRLEASLKVAQARVKHCAQVPLPSVVDVVDIVARASREASDNEASNDHGQLTLGDGPGASRYFGGAGAAYLVSDDDRDITRKRSTRAATDDPLGNAADWFPIFGGLSNAPHTLAAICTYLPPLATARRLTTVYFEDASFINHIVDRSTFDDVCISHVYQNGDVVDWRRVDNHRLAILLLVLAIGVQMDLSIQPYDSLGETFFRLARASLSLDTSSSIAFIQAVHLMSRYHVNSQGGVIRMSGFWSVIGFAVRCCQQLGLHRDGAKWGLEKVELEVRRRVFWEIHTEDILQSMTQGRPRLVLSEGSYDVELPSLEVPITLRMLFHHYKYRLAKLLTRVNDLQISVLRPAYKDILQVDHALRQFESELPEALRFDESRPTGVDRVDALQQIVMKVMITEGFLFLHRSHFAWALTSNPSQPLESHFRFSYVSVLESSRVMIHMLQCALTRHLHEGLTSRFWIFFFHAFSAIINFAATVIRSPTSSLAGAAFAQMQVGVALFQRVDPACAPRNDLPALQRLLERASLALVTARASSPDHTEDLLGVGTTLRRVRASEPSLPIVALSTHEIAAAIGEAVPALPTTLEDAVAVQNEFLADPWNPIEWTTPEHNETHSTGLNDSGPDLMSLPEGVDAREFGDEFFDLDNFLA